MKNTTNQELIKIPQSVLTQIKQTIDKHIKDNPRKNGFDEIAVYFATTFISINQLRKIASFYNTFTPSETKENQQRKQIYDEANLLPFVDGTLSHLKRLQQRKVATTTNGSQTGREVDRNGISKTQASVRPPKIEPNPTTIQEAQNKFNHLINYGT